MIQAFLDSWPLFHNTYIAGWCLATLLSLVGLVIVARDQVFLGLAVSQASLLGVATGMWVGATLAAFEPLSGEWGLSAWSIVFAMLGAAATARPSGPGKETAEARTGWVYVFSASAAVLLLSRSPHGLEEVHRLLSSTIIGAREADVLVFASLLAVTAAFAFACRDQLALLMMDADMAGAVGLHVARWNLALSLWAALVIGLAMRVSGLLFTFGSLVLPALVAKNLVREVRTMFWAAPCIALGSTIVAFVLANHYDFPPGQVAACVEGGLLLVAWLARGRT